MNDSALIEGLRRHDAAAVKHLSECYLPSIWRFACVRVKGDRHLAEDIVSEAVLALLRAVADQSVEIGNPLGWLRSVVSNKVADHFRAAARVQHLIDQAKHSLPDADHQDAAHRQELEERREGIREILEQLPLPMRCALEWKYLEKLSVREIAERLDVTEKAAESVLFRGRREFRQRMELREKTQSDLQSADASFVHRGTRANSRSGRTPDLPDAGPTDTDKDTDEEQPPEPAALCPGMSASRRRGASESGNP